MSDIVTNLQEMEAAIASAASESVTSTKQFITSQLQANAEKITAYERVAQAALAHANILKAENEKLAPFV